jgi:hypothetical protein
VCLEMLRVEPAIMEIEADSSQPTADSQRKRAEFVCSGAEAGNKIYTEGTEVTEGTEKSTG